jgi:hypothetical protein
MEFIIIIIIIIVVVVVVVDNFQLEIELFPWFCYYVLLTEYIISSKHSDKPAPI